MTEPENVARVRAIYDAEVEVATPSGEKYTRPAHLLFERADVRCLLNEIDRLRRGLMGAAMFARPASQVAQAGAMLSLEQARARHLCRICGQPDKGSLELHFGAEYAHTTCLWPVKPKPAPTEPVVFEKGHQPHPQE